MENRNDRQAPLSLFELQFAMKLVLGAGMMAFLFIWLIFNLETHFDRIGRIFNWLFYSILYFHAPPDPIRGGAGDYEEYYRRLEVGNAEINNLRLDSLRRADRLTIPEVTNFLFQRFGLILLFFMLAGAVFADSLFGLSSHSGLYDLLTLLLCFWILIPCLVLSGSLFEYLFETIDNYFSNEITNELLRE